MNGHSNAEIARLNRDAVQDAPSDVAEEEVRTKREVLLARLTEAMEITRHELVGKVSANLREYASDFCNVIAAIQVAHSRGRSFFFVGIGKSNLAASQLARIFQSMGFAAHHLVRTDGDVENLVAVRDDDVVFLISQSGQSFELLRLLPNLNKKRCVLVALTGNKGSDMVRQTHLFLSTFVTNNPSPVAEAPTTSTTAAIAIGAATAIIARTRLGCSLEEFRRDHPGDDVAFEGRQGDQAFDDVALAHTILRDIASAVKRQAGRQAFLEGALVLARKMLAASKSGRTIYIIGAGSSLDVAAKFAATLTSLGVSTFALNPTDLLHGDLGHFGPGNLAIFISHGGETQSVLRAFENVLGKGVAVHVITGDAKSTLSARATGNVLLVGEDVSDALLVPIPGQKVLPTIVNLVVGDCIAILMGHLVGVSNEKFARETHPGGAVGRSIGQLSNEVLEFGSEGTIGQTVTDAQEHSQLMSYIRRRDSGVGKEALLIGEGATNLALIGFELSKQGYALNFVEKSEQRAKEMANLGTYRVQLCTSVGFSVERVGKVTSLGPQDGDKLLALALRTDAIFVSIGANNIPGLRDVLVDIVRVRYRHRIQQPMNIVFVENIAERDSAIRSLAAAVKRALGSTDLSMYAENHLGFVAASCDALIPEIASLREPVRREACEIAIYIDDASWKGDKALQWGSPFKLAANYQAQYRKKLLCHNLGHAIFGYLGAARGYRMMHEAARDGTIVDVAREAMTSVGRALESRERLWEEPDVAEYVDTLIARYRNTNLRDTVARVCREPLRKLQKGDRLIGATEYVARYSSAPLDPLLIGIVAAAKYAVATRACDDYFTLIQTLADRLEISEAYSSLQAAARAFEKIVGTHGTRRKVANASKGLSVH